MDAQSAVAWYFSADEPAHRIDAAHTVLEYIREGIPIKLTIPQELQVQRRVLELLDAAAEICSAGRTVQTQHGPGPTQHTVE